MDKWTNKWKEIHPNVHVWTHWIHTHKENEEMTDRHSHVVDLTVLDIAPVFVCDVVFPLDLSLCTGAHLTDRAARGQGETQKKGQRGPCQSLWTPPPPGNPALLHLTTIWDRAGSNMTQLVHMTSTATHELGWPFPTDYIMRSAPHDCLCVRWGLVWVVGWFVYIVTDTYLLYISTTEEKSYPNEAGHRSWVVKA